MSYVIVKFESYLLLVFFATIEITREKNYIDLIFEKKSIDLVFYLQISPCRSFLNFM